MAIIAIICIIHIITIFRIIICFQGWNEGTIEGLGSSVGHSRSTEQEQYTSIPNCVWRYNESSIIDARRPNHDGVHAMTSIEHFWRKRIAVNPLHTLVLGVPLHQTIEKCKMALVLGRSILAAPMSQGGQLPDKMCVIICIRCIMRIILKGTKNNFM